MKKLLVLTVMVSMVMGFSFAVMADAHEEEEARLEVGIEIGEYSEFGIVTDYFSFNGEPIAGLFNEDVTAYGMGYYISDGGSTESFAQWIFDTEEDAVNNAVLHDEIRIETLFVAANHDVNLTMSSDFDGWPALRTFFRLSSDANIDEDSPSILPADFVAEDWLSLDNYADYQGVIGGNNVLRDRGTLTAAGLSILNNAEGFGSYGTDLAWISNFEQQTMNFSDMNHVSEELLLEFRECTPYLLHVNGGIDLEKITAAEAGEFSTDLVFTVAAANNNNH